MLRTRSPLLFKCIATPEKPFDLHVLTTPPAFILSQDQTLRKKRVTNPSDSWTTYWNGPEGPFRINLEYVDWGSQSIVQSKFQRTGSRYGKDFQEDICVLLRQYFSRKKRKKLWKERGCFLVPLTNPLRWAHRIDRRDRGKCKLAFVYQDLFG